MFTLNGSGKKILKLMRNCALTEYESKVYFTLLVEGKSKPWDLSIKSSVPQSKVYYTIQELEKKQLAYVIPSTPKIVCPREFKKYLNTVIREKQNEIRKLEEIGSEIGRSAYSLNRIKKKIRGRYRVFETRR